VQLFDGSSVGLRDGVELILVDRKSKAEVSRKVATQVSIVPGKSAARVDLEGVVGREAADALKGLTVELPRDSLPPLDDDEFYLVDAVGLPVDRLLEDGTVQALGRVVAVTTNGAQDLFEVEYRGAGGRARRWLIPVLPVFIKEVDDEHVRVDPPLGMLPDELEQP
ncbi:MAG: ribosome maturation factor RimM, partial [Myxococcota bacterium]